MPNNCRWRGNAPSVAQINLVTIYHVTDGVTYTLTHGGKSVSYTATGADTTTTVMAALATLWNAAIQPQFSEITAVGGVGVLTLTADNAGVPFDLTVAQSGAGGNNESKTVTIGHSPTGGTWSWIDATYGTASGLAYNISDSDLEIALEILYGSGNVTVAMDGTDYVVTFGGTLAHINIPDTTFDSTGLTGGDATVAVVETRKGSSGVSEVQTITFVGSASGGTFTAGFNGFLTAGLAYNISNTDFQTALRALPSIGGANVTVSGSAGGPYTATFGGALATTAVSAIEIDTANLTGGTVYGTMATTTPGVDGVDEVQYLTISQNGLLNQVITIQETVTASAGTFRIGYNGGYTAPINWDAKLFEILDAIDAVIESHSTLKGPFLAPVYAYQANNTMTMNGGVHRFQAIGGQIPNPLEIDIASLTGTYVLGGTAGNMGSPELVSPGDGAFSLSFGGSTTPSFAYVTGGDGSDTFTSPTAAAVQDALEALPGIGVNNVEVTKFRTPGSTLGKGLFILRFRNALAGTPVAIVTGGGGISTTGKPFTINTYTQRNGTAGVNEVQTLTLAGTPAAGNFRLSVAGQQTTPLAYNASAADVQTALRALSSVPDDGVICTGGALPGTPVVITASGAWIYRDIPAIIIDDSGLKSLVVETTPGVAITNEIQTVSLTGSPFSGTATLTYNAHTTTALASNATATDVQAALIALSDFAPGDVVCTGGPWPAGIACTFGAAFAATDVAAITGSGASLNNGSVTSTSIDPMNIAITTPNSGPADVMCAANWSDETLPVTGDFVIIDQGASPILYNLDQLPDGLGGFDHYARYTGQIGLPEINNTFGQAYYEFRPQYLRLDTAAINVGLGGGNGSGRMKLMGVVGTNATVNIYKTDSSLDNGIEPLLLVLPATTNNVNVNRGVVGIAIYAGQTSNVATLKVGFETNLDGDSTVRCGAGVTLGTIEQSGGVLATNSNITTLNMTGGELQHLAGTLTTANVDGGAVRYVSAGTLTTAILGSGGNLDYRQDIRSKTLTNLAMNEGSEYHDPHGVVALTNGVDFVRCTPADCVFEVRPNQTWTPSVI